VIKIRQAKPLDASNILRLLLSCHSEGGAYPEADEARAINWIARTLAEGYVMCVDLSGRIVGSMALTSYQFPWSPKWFLYLEWLYVQKKYRELGAFDALMKAAHAFADDKNAPILLGINAGGDNIDIKDRLLKMKGYQYLGGTFLRSEHGRVQQDEAEES
jgi:predicted N-acetyltransferase YhbS